jgi:excisionase family DNA binding protein
MVERRTLTIEQAAKALGISRTGAYQLAARGELPGVIRLGRRLLIPKAALEKLLGAPIDDERQGGGEGA